MKNFAAQGFTLLELLIALAIFAIIAALAYGGLNSVLSTESRLDEASRRLAELQSAFLFLGRDVQQYSDRPVRDEFGDREPALRGAATQFSLTRAGWRNPLGQARSTLQRVSYTLEGRSVYRGFWPVLDRAQDSRPLSAPLLEDVENFEVRYLDAAGGWHSQWPPSADGAGADNPVTMAAPRALEISLTLPEWGTLTRLFALPLAVRPVVVPEAPPPDAPQADAPGATQADDAKE